VELSVATAAGSESPTLVAGIVDRLDPDTDADDSALERKALLVLERLTERPELLVQAVGVDRHRVDQFVDLVAHRVGHYDPAARIPLGEL